MGNAQDQRERDATARLTATFAALLDRPGNGCFADLVAAAPKTEAARKLLCDHTIPGCAKNMPRCQRLLGEDFKP